MPIQRVRFKKFNENQFVTVRTIKHPNNISEYSVELDLNDPEWRIIEVGSGLVAASGRNIDKIESKKEIKVALEALGIIFDKETRNVSKRSKSESKIS